MSLVPIVLIVVGIIVLIFGRRLAILGAAVGALIGFILVRLLNDPSPSTQLLIVLGLALGGFFAAAFARGIVEVVILVIGALAGAGIVLGFLNLFNLDLGLLGWLLAVVGAVIGFMLIRRSRRGSRDWGMVILASLVGAILIARGLTQLIPALQDTLISSIVFVVALAFGIIYQGGYLSRLTGSKETQSPPPPPAGGSTTSGDASPPPTSGGSTTSGDAPPPAGQ